MTTGSASDTWFVPSKAGSHVRLRVFCFPYAGGGASVFRAWANYLPSDVQVCALQLPGRHSRLSERPYWQLKPLVQRLGEVILPLVECPFALFGHSMGALLGFELLRHLRNQHGLSPVYFFASGGQAPHLLKPGPPLHTLPEQAFITELYRLNSLPVEALQSAELMRLILPALRADIALCETYIYSPGAPLDCPISTFRGMQDYRITQYEIDAWAFHTRSGFKLRVLPGDHFFLETARTLLLRAICDDLGFT